MVWNYRMRECVALWGLFRLRPPPPLFFNTSRARTQSLIRPLLIGKYTLGAVVRCRVALLRNNLLFITLNNSRLWARTLKAPCKKVLFFASRSRAHAAIVIKYNVCAWACGTSDTLCIGEVSGDQGLCQIDLNLSLQRRNQRTWLARRLGYVILFQLSIS